MSLESVWFFLWGLLWAVFFITDGFDFGVGTLYPFLGKSETDRRIMINSLGPLWDGNEVWLIAAGGVTFAAFPVLYATMFSSFYAAFMLILFALIFRGVSFEFRGKVDHPFWKRVWDSCLFVGSAVPAVLFGLAFANIFQGLPLDAAGYHGGLLSLINPYGVLGGLLFLLLFLEHGALWLCLKTEGALQERAMATAGTLWFLLVAVAGIFLVASAWATPLYENYLARPVLLVVPVAAVVAMLGIKWFARRWSWFAAWLASAVAIFCCTFFGFIGLYPDLFPSAIDAAFSITAFTAASSPLTLTIMLVVVLIFIPLVIGYQIWTYLLFRGKVTEADLEY